METPPKTPLPELLQEDVKSLRPEDLIVIVQHGREKRLLVATIIDQIRDRVVEGLQTRAPVNHEHPISEITNLTAAINAMVDALANKAALAHGHDMADTVGLTAAIATIGKAIMNTTTFSAAFPVVKSATVAGGNAVFQLTDDNLANGAALFPNGVALDSLMLRAEEGTTPHAFGTPALSNGGKTLTVPVSKIAPVLGILNLNQNANGSVVRAIIWGR